MQLKSLGKIEETLKTVNNLVSSGATGNLDLANSLKGLSAAEKVTLLSRTTLTESQKIGILATSGIRGEELKNIVTTNALSTSQKAATASTAGFTTALKGLWATMMANPLIAIGMAVTAISTAWNIYNQHVQEAIQASNKATDEFNSASSAIKDYADRYKELHTELLDANTSEERQHEIKSDLLSLQKELNDTYGDEHGRLNLVTDAYKDQTNAILAMNKAAAQNYLLDNKKGIETATTEMAKERTYELGSTGVLNDDYSKELYNLVSLYKDQGINLTQVAGTDLPAYTITFNGNAEEAEKVIRELSNKIQDLDAEFKDNDAVGSVLSYTTSALKNNKSILDNYQADYDASLMANIASDDELSKGYDKAYEAVTRYNEAVISGDESKILDARNNLDKVKNSIDLSSEDWIRYGSIMSNVFNEANTGIYDFRDALANNQNGMGNFISGLQGKTKEELLAMQNDAKFDNFDKLIASAEDYGLTVEQVIDELVRMGVVQDKVAGKDTFTPLSKSEVISNINSLSEGFESLDKIMKSISDKDNPFDYALLDDTKFKNNFGELGDSYTNFIEKVSNSPKDISAVKSAFNDLVTEWIDSKGVLNGVTAETSNLSVAMLKNMGVANAEEVVLSQLTSNQEHLAAQKAYTAEMSDVLSNATANEIPGLIEEATQSDIAKVALAGLALEKANANGTILNTSGDIENAIALIETIGAATTALVAYNKAKAGDIFDSETQKANLNSLLSQKTGLELSVEIDKQLDAYQEKMDNLKADVDKEVQDAIKKSSQYKGTGAEVNAVYNGGPKTNKGGSSGKDKKDTSKDIDWIDRQLKLLDDKRTELLNKSNDTYIDYLGITRDQFNRAQELFNSDLESMPSGFDELGDMARSAGMTIAELYSLIANGVPGESRQSYLEQTLEVDKEALVAYGDAVQKYQEEYDKSVSKISPQYRAKIENGDLSIDTLSGDESEEVQKAITDYDKLNETKKAQYEKQKQYLDDIAAKYDNISASIQNENKQLENSNSVLEKQIEYYQSAGTIVDSSLYSKLSQNTADQINNSRELLANKRAELQDMVSNGVETSSEEYIKLKGEISDAEVNIYALKKAQEDYNNMLLQLPIDNLATIVSMYQDIGSAISNWGAEYEAGGGKLNADYYQNMISNSAKVTDSLKEQASLIEDTMSNYDVGSDRYLELYKQLKSVNSEMSNTVQNMKKLNEEMLKLPLENIGGFSSELQKVADGLSKVQSDQDQVISAVTGAIQKQIEAINKQRDTFQETNESQKKGLQDKLDLLQKQNDQLKRQMAYEQSLYNLQKINQQATEKVIRNGQETYEVDADKLRDAQEQVQDAKFDLETGKIKDQIDALDEALEKQNELYDSQIEKLESIADRWKQIAENVKTAQDETKADESLGSGWKDKILSGNDTALFDTFSGMYQNTAEQLKKYQDQIDSTNNIQSLLEDYVASYREGTISYDVALKGINSLLSQLNKSMSASTNLDNILDYLSTTNGTEANADAVLKGIQSGLKDTATELLASMEQYNKNSGMISEYTSSWQQLTNNVASMLDVMKEVRDNLEDSYDRDDEDNDNTRYGGGKDGSPGTPGRGEYVNSGPGVSRKDGITRGLIGSTSDSDREATMKLLGLKKLDPDEVPAVLHMGEAVFNEEQQKNLLNNFASAQRFVPTTGIPNYSDMLSKVNVRQKDQTIHISYGDMTFPNVRNAEDVIEEFVQLSEMAMRQELSKFK